MSVTIDSLDIQIRSSAGSAAANIDRLADSLKRLRENGKLTVVSNNLTKLADALGRLQSTSRGLSNLRGLAGAMRSLSAVQKSAGLNSVLNSLKKLPDIVNRLDPATLAAFTAKIRQLAAALAPLAAQVDRVGTAFTRLPTRISQIVTATNRMSQETRRAADAAHEHGRALNAQSINLAAAITNIQGIMGALQGVRDKMTEFIADAIEWDGIQFRFGRAFGEDADMVYEYAQKVSDVLKINQQQFMQYSSLYGSLLSGFGMEQKKVTAISVGLTELSYDIWAAYNDRFKTLEEASEAVRSAITGEIEPIRNAGIALTEASMQEYLDGLGLAHVRMANLSEAQKAQVRYAVMANAAMNQGIIGTYANEMQTAEGAVRTLTQQMKTLGQGIGSIFIPILQAVIPWISAFVSILYDAVAAVAAFFGIPFFKISWGAPAAASTKSVSSGLDGIADSAGGVTKSAGTASKALKGAKKEAKKFMDYTMGFDELNVITPPSESGSDGGGGGNGGGGGGRGGGGGGDAGGSDWEGLDLETLWDDSVFGQAAKQVDELKQKILDWFAKWKAEIAIISAALATLSIASLLEKLGKAVGLGEKFLKTMKNIKKLAATAIVITLQFALMKSAFSDFMGKDGSIWDYVKALLIGGAATWVLYSMWGPTGLVIGFGVTAIAALSAVVENGGINSWESLLVGLTGISAAIASIGIAWKKAGLGKAMGEVRAFFSLLREGNSLISVLAAAFPGLANAIAPALGQIGAFIALLREGNSLWAVMAAAFPRVAGALASAATAVGTFVAGLTGPMIAAAAAVIAGIASVALFLARNWDKVTVAAKEFFKENIAPKLERIKESWEEMKEALAPLAPLFDKIKKKLDPLIKSVTDFFKEIDINVTLKGISSAFEVLGGIVFSILTGPIAGAFSAVVSIIEGFVQTISGVVQVVAGVIELIAALFTGGDVEGAAQKMVTGVGNIFGGLWTIVSAPITEFWSGVLDWFTSLYEELVGHSIVPDMIDEIVDWFLSLPKKIFKPVDEFTSGIIKKFKKMWEDIKAWWSSKVAPKFTQEYWRKVFDVIRAAISTKLTEVKRKISEKWAEIKSWFNQYVAPKFTISYWKGKFNSIREAMKAKLSETKTAASDKWGEIKGWYNKNVAPKFTKDFWTNKFSGLKNGLIAAISGGINGAVAKINAFISWLNAHLKITLPSITVAGKQVFAGASFQVVTIPSIPSFAQGGFIEDGLFTMNQGEIAGKFSNGRSVVANNQQIIDGIAAGVYEAVVAAMNDARSSEGQAVNVYLDGKQIYASVKKTEAERGVNLMGNQLGYAY